MLEHIILEYFYKFKFKSNKLKSTCGTSEVLKYIILNKNISNFWLATYFSTYLPTWMTLPSTNFSSIIKLINLKIERYLE